MGHELESLQHKEDDTHRASASRQALRFLQSSMLSSHGRRCHAGDERSVVFLQQQAECCQEAMPRRCTQSSNMDDEVLGCAVHFHRCVAPGMTELLTEDKGLAIKAGSYGVPTESIAALMTRGAHVLAEYALGASGSEASRRELVFA